MGGGPTSCGSGPEGPLFAIRFLHGQHACASPRDLWLPLNAPSTLAPILPWGISHLAGFRVYLGRSADAIDPMLRSLRLNPNDRQSHAFLGQAALAQYHLANFEEAAEFRRRALRVRRLGFILRILLAALGQLGRSSEAAVVLTELYDEMPPASTRLWEVTLPYADPAARAFFDDGLRKAGLPI